MRHKGDRLLPVPCTKTTALQLVDDALTKRSLDTGRQIAEECLEREFILKRTETMLICIMIFATSEPQFTEPDPDMTHRVNQLWDQATKDLPWRYHDEAVGLLIRLADIYVERGHVDRALNTLFAAEEYAVSDASRLQYNAARERYEELKQPPRLGTVIDFHL